MEFVSIKGDVGVDVDIDVMVSLNVEVQLRRLFAETFANIIVYGYL